MGMKLASKFNGTLMVKSKLFKLVKGVLNITGPANTQKDSMKSHSLVSSRYLIPIKYTCRWEKNEKKAGFEGCAATLSSLPMSVLTKPAPQGLLLRALMIILPPTLWRSVFMLEM
eukprot:426001-Pelagomonas_calceolata.AAC.1